jgi:hypothetical protein
LWDPSDRIKEEIIVRKYQLLITGRYVDIVSKKTFEDINPTTGHIGRLRHSERALSYSVTTTRSIQLRPRRLQDKRDLPLDTHYDWSP